MRNGKPHDGWRVFTPGVGFERGPFQDLRCFQTSRDRRQTADNYIIGMNATRLECDLDTDLESPACDIEPIGTNTAFDGEVLQDLYRADLQIDPLKGNIMGIGEFKEFPVAGICPSSVIPTELLVAATYKDVPGATAVWHYYLQDLENSERDTPRLRREVTERALFNLIGTMTLVNGLEE